jgi:hypothetical protein
VIVTQDKIKRKYRENFENRNILILGAPEAGKTSLIQLLTTGKPGFITSNGNVRGPDPTTGVVIIGEPADGLDTEQINHRENIPVDVAGDFTGLWRGIIKDINPHGIIYMLDGRRRDQELIADIENIFHHVLSEYPYEAKRLRALHIFINHSDQLSKSDRSLQQNNNTSI